MDESETALEEELDWVRWELERMISARTLCPLNAAERIRLEELLAREAELLGVVHRCDEGDPIHC